MKQWFVTSERDQDGQLSFYVNNTDESNHFGEPVHSNKLSALLELQAIIRAEIINECKDPE